MISITEGTPRKCSGATSLLIRFDYNPKAISVIKDTGCALWHKKDATWEAPLTALSFLLDNLTYVDDIELVLADDSEKGAHLLPSLEYKTRPFPHQLEAIEYGLNHDSWLLLDSPGLGKTLSMICLAEELRAQKGLRHCLIICGIATLRSNWEKEIQAHSDLSFVTIGKKVNRNGNVTWASVKERAAQLKGRISEFFVILNVESIRDDSVVDAINNSENDFGMIVSDEVHKMKSSQSNQGRNLLKLRCAKYRIGLSGTLILNNALDAYTPLRWIGAEHANLTTFKATYCEFGGFGGHEIVGFRNMGLLKDEIEGRSLRRTKDLMGLPPKNVIDEHVEMSPAHRKFYEDVRDGVREECDKISLNPNNVLALTTRLRQATSCPSALTSSGVVSSKVERCVDLVDEITAQGDKVVVMSTFKEPVYQLAKLLEAHRPLLGTGDMRDSEVSGNIDRFQTDDEHMVMIVTSAKCGTGITLNRARYMIMLDEPWTQALYEQCTDRIHRVNNTQAVFIYNLICDGTVDETVAQIIGRKKAISDFIVDDRVDEESMEILAKYIKGI